MADTSYTLEDLATVGHLKKLAERVHSTYATKAELTAGLATKVDREKLKKELGEALSKYATQDDLNAKISSVYKPKGSIEFSQLSGKNTQENLGNVYNISDGFFTDSTFIEGPSKSYEAGTNVVVVEDDSENYKFDVLSGSVDLSGYVQTETLASYATKAELASYVTQEDLTSGLTAEFAKKANVDHDHQLEDITDFNDHVATDEEVFNMLDEVFGLLSRASVMSTSATIDDLGGKKVSELIGEDVSIDSEGNVTGTLKKLDQWTEFGGDGTKNHYLPVCLDDCYKNKPITVKGSGDPKTQVDTEWILAVADKNSTFNFKDGETDLFTLHFTDATFEGVEN